MINDLQEIKKVLLLIDGDNASDSEVNLFLANLARNEDDSYFLDLRNYISNHNRECKEYFEPVCGKTVRLCEKEKCSECAIKKWCGKYREEEQLNEVTRVAFTYADFFCGAGGLSLGFKSEGFKLSLANDIQTSCIDTYSFNHPETPSKHIIAGDINNVIEDVERLRRFNEIDVVAGGPPCQGFSMANRQRLIDDPRNHLYKSYIAAIEKLKPKFVVMENVRGMLNVVDQICEDFGRIGYTITARLLNAKDFGVPQNRERVIFIGNRLGMDNDLIFDELYAEAAKKEKRVLADAIGDLPERQAKTEKNSTESENGVSGYTIDIKQVITKKDYIEEINGLGATSMLFNHKARYNNDRDIEIFGRLNPGDNSTDPKIQDIMPYKRREKIFKDKYYKLEMDRPCKTITAHMKFDCNMYIHPDQARGLTPREAARIQSYPDDYYFRGAYTTTYMQVGNSVPPLLSKTIATVIRHKLEEYYGGV